MGEVQVLLGVRGDLQEALGQHVVGRLVVGEHDHPRLPSDRLAHVLAAGGDAAVRDGLQQGGELLVGRVQAAGDVEDGQRLLIIHVRRVLYGLGQVGERGHEAAEVGAEVLLEGCLSGA